MSQFVSHCTAFPTWQSTSLWERRPSFCFQIIFTARNELETSAIIPSGAQVQHIFYSAVLRRAPDKYSNDIEYSTDTRCFFFFWQPYLYKYWSKRINEINDQNKKIKTFIVFSTILFKRLRRIWRGLEFLVFCSVKKGHRKLKSLKP